MPRSQTKPDTAAPDALAYLPLASLILSPLNARQIVDAAEIGAMADSISIIGLLQNLIGLQRDPGGPVEIVAGGKRLRALQLLADQGFMAGAATGLDFARIPVRLAENEQAALEMAGAENSARSQPHPADEVRAYGKMAGRGIPPRQIALTFAQTEAHVKRRLALASLPEPVLAALRANELTLDQAAAFTVAQSEAQAIEVLAALRAAGPNAWGWNAQAIRQKMTENRPRITDRRAIYVGLDAYRAAGGTTTDDLFADSAYVNDGALLDRLATEKLATRAEDLRQAEGWAFAECVTAEHEVWHGFDQIARTPGELSEGDTEEYDRLAELAEAGVLDAEGEAQLDALQDRLDGDWTDDDRARAGIAIWISHDGAEGVRRGLLRRGMAPAQGTAGEDGDDDTPTPAAAAPAGMPQNLRDDLRAIRLLALQNALLKDGALLMDLLQWQASGGDMPPWQMPLAVTFTHSANTPGVADGLTMPARLARPEPAMERLEPTPQAFAAWRAQPEADRHRGFIAALARAFCRDTGLLSVHLAQRLRPDARAIWTPTAKNFFGRLPAPMLDAIWHDLMPADRESQHEAFRAMTKRDKATELHRLFNSDDYREAVGLSRDQQARIAAWLPEDLRWPEADDDDTDQDGDEDAA